MLPALGRAWASNRRRSVRASRLVAAIVNGGRRGASAGARRARACGDRPSGRRAAQGRPAAAASPRSHVCIRAASPASNWAAACPHHRRRHERREVWKCVGREAEAASAPRLRRPRSPPSRGAPRRPRGRTAGRRTRRTAPRPTARRSPTSSRNHSSSRVLPMPGSPLRVRARRGRRGAPRRPSQLGGLVLRPTRPTDRVEDGRAAPKSRHASTGARRPRTARCPSGAIKKRPWSFRAVAPPITIVPGSAPLCSRAATFSVSPRATGWRSAAPTTPIATLPLLTPTRTLNRAAASSPAPPPRSRRSPRRG